MDESLDLTPSSDLPKAQSRIRSKADLLREQYLGKVIAILCSRYCYRGRVAEVGSDYMILTNAWTVERTGPASSTAAVTEDSVPSDLVVNVDAIEIIFQPAWAFNGFEDEEAEKETKTKGKKKKATV